MSAGRRAAGWVAKGLLAKLLWWAFPFLLVAGLIGGLLGFLLVNTSVAGWQQIQTQNVSAQCTVGIETVGASDGQTMNVPAEHAERIKKAADDTGLPETVVAAQIWAESNFDSQAGSHAGAKGLAQFIDSTFQKYVPGGDPYNPDDAMKAYALYMNDLKAMFAPTAGDDANKLLELTLAAYNAGPGAVQQYGGVPPYPETQGYVKKIMGAAQVKFSQGCAQTANVSWDGDLGDGEWTNPCPECLFTNGYGPRNLGNGVDDLNGGVHWGVDLATPGAGYAPGGPIVAPVDMVIVEEYPTDGCVWGTATVEPKFTFGFCHLHSEQVNVGQEMKRGDVIGVEGNTSGTILREGGALPPTHLHFEIYKPGFDTRNFRWFSDRSGNLDPEPLLKAKGAWVSQ